MWCVYLIPYTWSFKWIYELCRWCFVFSLNAYISLLIVFEIQRDYNNKGFVCQKFYFLSVLMAVIQRDTVFPERTLWKGEEGRLLHISGGLMCNLKGQCTLLSLICPVMIVLFLITLSNWDNLTNLQPSYLSGSFRVVPMTAASNGIPAIPYSILTSSNRPFVAFDSFFRFCHHILFGHTHRSIYLCTSSLRTREWSPEICLKYLKDKISLTQVNLFSKFKLK